MIRSLLVIIIGAVVLTSCSNLDQTETESAASGVGDVNEYWDAVAKQDLMMSPFIDPEPPFEYVRIGLKHASPDIRWFCAYKILKYAPSIDQEDREVLDLLTRDEAVSVRNAALFANEVLQESFAGDRFQRSPVNNQAAFHLYHEGTYNDGELWVAQDGKMERLAKMDGSITKLAYSPDGKRIGVEYGGRTWGSLTIVDVTSRKPIYPEVINAIIADPGNGYDVDQPKIDRFDPYLRILEWSPDSTRLLVSYEFGGGVDQYHYGWAVYDVEEDKVLKAYKTKQDVNGAKPQGFAWENFAARKKDESPVER